MTIMIKHQIIDGDKIQVLNKLELENKDFSGKDLIGFYISESHFSQCRFENLKVGSMYFGGGQKQSVYTDCSFDRSSLQGPTGGNARFERCSFLNVDLTNFFFNRNEFI